MLEKCVQALNCGVLIRDFQILRLKQLEFAFVYNQELRKYFVFVFISIHRVRVFCVRLFKVYVTPVASIGIFARYFHLLVDHN